MAAITMIAVLPIDNFDRRKHAEHLENQHLNTEQLADWRSRGAQFYSLTDFMDLCNDQELELGGHWISYIHHQDN
jgi:hypothetical protein